MCRDVGYMFIDEEQYFKGLFVVLGAICSTINIIAPPLKLQAFLMIDDLGAL